VTGKKETYSWTIRWLRLGWRDLIADDFRERPTRDVCREGITILLVGKPTGTLDFFFDGSDVGTEKMREMKEWDEEEDVLDGFCWARVIDRVELRSIFVTVGISSKEKFSHWFEKENLIYRNVSCFRLIYELIFFEESVLLLLLPLPRLHYSIRLPLLQLHLW